MYSRLALAILLSSAPSGTALAGGWDTSLVLTVEGMSCEVGCPDKVRASLGALPGVSAVSVDYNASTVCVSPAGAASVDTARKALAVHDYKVPKSHVGNCPAKKAAPGYHGMWRNTAGVDAKVISRGPKVDLNQARVTDKYTVFDFGAEWCAPCKVVEKKLRAALGNNPLLAVRAIDLGPIKTAYDEPVYQQHLAFVPGIPWLIVLAPNGKKIYQGQDASKALAAIDKSIAKTKK